MLANAAHFAINRQAESATERAARLTKEAQTAAADVVGETLDRMHDLRDHLLLAAGIATPAIGDNFARLAEEIDNRIKTIQAVKGRVTS